MAKRKGIETKAALLQQHFKGELKEIDENELGDWSKENIQKNRERYIRQHAESVGFESTFSHDGAGDLSWLEFVRPGEITSLRGGQTLARILARSK